MKSFLAPEALLPEGWAREVQIDVDDAGTITSVRAGAAGNKQAPKAAAPAGLESLGGPVVPGMADVHSHAFQRAMAGLAERFGSVEDSFWTWRETMYEFIRRVGPVEAHAIAAQLYCELLRNGYTGVAEFHYLHRAPDGKPYARRSEMAMAHVRAAQDTGIAITLLPSLYAYSGFGAQPLSAGQKRFSSTPDDVLHIAREVLQACAGNPDVRIGIAPHSLRAVSPPLLKDLIAGLDAIDRNAPIHIHVAEQVKEVNDCLQWSDLRPAQWLLEQAGVDKRWCLIHCTHVSTPETERLAACGCVVGLCPSTEGNLGDGVFPFMRFRDKGGRFGIGSDSQVSQSPIEELRWLEYSQRLTLRRRNVTASSEHPAVGTNLWREAATGGAQALGRPMGAIAAGHRADLVVLDGEHVNLDGRSGDRLMDALIFCGNERLVKHVMVGGRWIVRHGHHPEEKAIEARYRQVQRALLA
jgi:formimidoylglutamate deiminase